MKPDRNRVKRAADRWDKSTDDARDDLLTLFLLAAYPTKATQDN